VKKILFLDFDGVLHNTTSSEDQLFNRLDLLAEALQTNPCSIVISSSWRFHHDISKLKDYLQPISKLIIGTTGEPFIGRFPRYNEIKEYVLKNFPFANWRALDDSFLEFPKDCMELILCNGKTGLTKKETIELSDWLKK
jgi:HAD domain in Swiss Army Knife RNA repair proteins